MLLMSTLLKIDVSKAAEEKRNHPTSLSTQNEERYSRQWIVRKEGRRNVKNHIPTAHTTLFTNTEIVL